MNAANIEQIKIENLTGKVGNRNDAWPSNSLRIQELTVGSKEA